MAFILKDRVLETSSTTGTGSFTLSGAVTGFVTFSSAIGNTNTTYYTIENPNTTEWEVGVGTVSAGTISRDTVLASSTGSKVNFTGGTKNVFCDYPATKSVYQDASGVVTVPSLVATTSLNATGTVSFNGLQGTAGQVLQSNGTGVTPTWVASPAAGAGGSNTQIQYNNSGVLAGNSTYTMVSGVMKENGYNFVSQADVGSAPNQIPLNQYLGSMAYEDKAGVNITGGTAKFTATIGVGNATPSTSGSGVSFPATQSASTDPNTLDDYEEGTYTPVVTSGSGSITSYTASGAYTKVGNLVTLSVDITITNNGTGATNINATLPFNCASTSTYMFGVGQEISQTGVRLYLQAVSVNNTVVTITTIANAYPALTNARLVGSITYRSV